MEVEVDVHQKNGAQRVQVADADPTYRTAVFARQERAVDDLIADIIMQNGGGPNANLPRLAATRPLLRASTDQLGSAERAGSSAR
jgi:hypothetical protein